MHSFVKGKYKKGTISQASPCRVIGVMSIGRAVGGTHFCIMLANYLTHVRGLSVAVGEYNGHKDFDRIAYEITGKCNDNDYFQHCDIDFYQGIDSDELTKIVNKDYNIIILDLECGYKNSLSEFMRSSIKIIVCGMELWKMSAITLFLKSMGKDNIRDAICISLSYNKNRAAQIAREYAVRVLRVPFEADPFSVSSQNLLWLKDVSGL